MKTLLMSLEYDYDFVYLRTEFGGCPGQDGLPAGPSYVVPMFATVTNKSLRATVRAFFATFSAAWGAIGTHAPTVALGIGCSHLVPIFLAARLRRKPTIFIETITRGDKLSNTGRVVYYLKLATHFIVQWPNLRETYPRARIGTIL